MSNAKGWGLTGRLITKHFGALGDKIAEAIANFDPETATEADRDNLANNLRTAATKLAAARTAFNKERDDVVKLKDLIETDEKAFETLATRLDAGTITEATVNLFCDELENNKARISVEEQEEADAKEYLDELQSLVDAMSTSLSEFDANAKKALQALATAKAKKELQDMRIERQSELSSLSGLKTKSSALDALTKRAEKVANEAEGLKTLADINQKPQDQQAELAALRKSVSIPVTETAAARLKRLSNKAA